MGGGDLQCILYGRSRAEDEEEGEEEEEGGEEEEEEEEGFKFEP